MKRLSTLCIVALFTCATSQVYSRSCTEAGMSTATNKKATTTVAPKVAQESAEQKMDLTPEKGSGKIRPKPQSEFKMRWKDMQFYMGGRIRSEYFYINNFGTLGADDFFDEHGWFRQKVNIDTLARFGKAKYGKSVADGRIRLTAFTHWRDNRRYTPLSEERVEVGNALVGEHTHANLAPLWYLEEAWLEAHLGKLWGVFEKNEHSLKLGYFAYILGRGVSLGEYFDLSITYMGWDAEATSNATFKTPGALWKGTIIPEKLTYEIYYQKWREENNNPSKNREPVRQHRLEGHRPERGMGSDWDIWSARLDLKLGERDWKLWAQPYILYHIADDQIIEIESDADARLGTGGFMIDVKYGGFTANVEFAKQFGNQILHAIDRNQVTVSADDSGKLCEVYTHVLEGSGQAFRARAPRSDELSKLVDNEFNRQVSRNGEPIVKDVNGVLTPVNAQGRTVAEHTAALTLHETSIGTVGGTPASGPFVGVFNGSTVVDGPRFRDRQKLKFQGFMLLGDMAYQFKKPSLKVAVTGGYISGDKFPYNDTKCKNYKGFLTLQDSDYLGWDVNSFALLYSRAIPRPTDVNERRMFAENNRDDMSNLAILGTNCTWTPLKNKKQLVINPGILWYWQTTSLPKWDKSAVHPDPVTEVVKQRLGIVGWQSEAKASKYIGAELNIDLYYNVVDNLQFRFLAAILFPGQLFKDIDGMPNRQTRRTNANGDPEIRSLGHDTVFGMLARLTYYF